jgi:prephenate dehydrogenase
MINRLVILGVGLIGGSLARALRDANAVGEIVGFGRGLANLQLAVEQGVVDRIETSVARAVQDADVVVIAVPMASMNGLLQEMAPYLGAQTIVTDVGSVKGSVVAAARQSLGPALARFVPGHPIAGTEKSGVAASFPTLFVNRRVVLTPLPENDALAVARVRAMWEATGAEVMNMPAEEHDEVLAATSHLPHLLAFALVDLLASRPDRERAFALAASGFRDSTRIASSDPVMWRDIALTNRDALRRVLTAYRAELDMLLRAIEAGDGETLQQLFARAKTARDALVRNDP